MFALDELTNFDGSGFVFHGFRRSGVVAMASVGQKVYAPGVAVSEGNGGLPKIDLKSPDGR